MSGLDVNLLYNESWGCDGWCSVLLGVRGDLCYSKESVYTERFLARVRYYHSD